ncbi:hypothetical protein HN512_02945 [Candidatus Peregrinibacteria bacterium]|jgi:hypothetical protein|nr:hypothetical protein [Candidatus Peregrinibacteria bacterium]MBT3598769.1 hypothetical protein [Candidatus Peregrinibacteria bacterium]MBT4367563.1 hypothetical protein [Candidatus Peregrinibacteria bacterium]MBT4585837.1 hypothetical protein [Candidatus Peregrinibacteria bacterium]MBT6731221.1 hypothetical protein [Candidatus Peregrinibacteria bacterium]
MKILSIINRPKVRVIGLHIIALTLLIISAQIMSKQVRAIANASQVSLPLVAELPVLERRLNTITQQIEMAELNSVLKIGSQKEQVDVLILPKEPDFDRLISIFDVLQEGLKSKNILKNASKIDIGDPIEDAYPIHFSFDVHEEGLRKFLSFTRIAGLLTVGDALSPEEREMLIHKTEEENPTGIIALEQFFSTDLLRYALDSRSHEEQLLRSFSSSDFVSLFRMTMQSSLLREVRILFEGDFGQLIDDHNLWPFPMLIMDSINLKKGGAPKWRNVSVQLFLYTAH